MRLYETLCLLRPDLEEEELKASIEKIRTLIEKAGGAVKELQHWGKRRLAYLVEDYAEGHYVLLTFRADFEIVQELKHLFKVDESYLRCMTLRLEEEAEKESEETPVADGEQPVAEETPAGLPVSEEPAASGDNVEDKNSPAVKEGGAVAE